MPELTKRTIRLVSTDPNYRKAFFKLGQILIQEYIIVLVYLQSCYGVPLFLDQTFLQTTSYLIARPFSGRLY